MNLLKKASLGFLDFFFVNVLLYFTLLLGLLNGLRIIMQPELDLMSIPFMSWILLPMLAFSWVSLLFYLALDIFLNIQILFFAGNLSLKLDYILNLIHELPMGYKTKDLAKTLATDTTSTQYLGSITMIAGYEALAFGWTNIGYILLPVLTIFGVIKPIFVVFEWTSLLWMWCLVVFIIRYLMVFLVAIGSTRIAEKYNQVIVYHENNKS